MINVSTIIVYILLRSFQQSKLYQQQLLVVRHERCMLYSDCLGIIMHIPNDGKIQYVSNCTRPYNQYCTNSDKKTYNLCAVKQQLITTKYSFLFCFVLFYFALDSLGMSHLDSLVQELSAVCDKWQYIGEELGVHQFSLDYISANFSDPGDCLREVLRRWLPSCAATWKHIVAVLRTPRIGDSHLAEHLEAKYYSSEQTYSSVEAM